MASRAIDLLITYRIVKLLVKPFDKQEAFKYGIIDKDGNVLKKSKTLKTEKERKAYTILHRFVFNLKRILKRVGLGSRLGSFAVALALLIKENKELGFMLNIKGSGSMSFRSIGANVQEIAKEYFNGGGHKEASGGRIKFNKRMNSKEEVEEFLCSFNYIEKVE